MISREVTPHLVQIIPVAITEGHPLIMSHGPAFPCGGMREIRLTLTHGFFCTWNAISHVSASLLILLDHLHSNAVPDFFRVRDGLAVHRDRMGEGAATLVPPVARELWLPRFDPDIS